MKKIWMISSCLLLLLISACQQQEANYGGSNEGREGKGQTSILRFDNGNTNKEGGNLSIFGTKTPPYNEVRTSGVKHFGFVEQKDNNPEVIHSNYGANYYIDRSLLADAISKITVGLQNIHTAHVLVTENVAIIGYQGDPTRPELQNQVEKTGLSATPRWYKVYATSDPQIIERIRQIGLEHTENGVNERKLIKQVDELTRLIGKPARHSDNDENDVEDRNRNSMD